MNLAKDFTNDLTVHYEQLRQEILSSSLDRARSKFRGVGILVSRGIVGWIEVINDIYPSIADPSHDNHTVDRSDPPKSISNKTELTSLLAEIALRNLSQEASI
jgi:hypothetical protein